MEENHIIICPYFVILLGFGLFGKQQDNLDNMMRIVSAVEEDSLCAVSFHGL